MSVLHELSQSIVELLKQDSRRVLLGEDVLDGGMLGLSSQACDDEEVRGQLIATPLTPHSLLAHATGMALGGAYPIVLMGSESSLHEGFAALREAGVAHSRSVESGGRTKNIPLLVVAPTGPGFGLGNEHATVSDALLASLPSIRVVTPGSTNNIEYYLRQCAQLDEHSGPTLLLIPRDLLLQQVVRIPDVDADIGAEPGGTADSSSIDRATVHGTGTDATVFAWGSTVNLAKEAASLSGRDVLVVDVSCLAPLDEQTLIGAANRTGRVVIAHAGAEVSSVASQIASLIAERSIFHLDAPILRVCGATGPLNGLSENSALPQISAIKHAIEQVTTNLPNV